MKEQLSFEDRLKIYCKINQVKFKEIAAQLEISPQELHNILHGFQQSIPSKGIDSIEQVRQKIRKNLSLKF